MNLHGILNKGQGRRRVERQVAMLAAIGVAMLGGIAAVATTAQAASESQVWVCKYVGTPFVNETLQSKDGLIRVDANSTGGATVGNFFTDQQGQSLVLDVATDANTSTGGGEGEQYTGGLTCPAPRDFPVTPPVFTSGNCEAVGTVVAPDTDAYHWVITGSDSATVYTAVANDGFILAAPTVFGPYDLTKLTGAQCAGRVVLPTLSATRVCNAVGSVNAVDTTNFTWGFTGPDTARTYTATAIGGVVLVGTNPQGPFDVSAIPSQSVHSAAACFVAKPVVKGVVENAPVVAGVVENAPVVAGVVKSAPVKSLAFTGAETVPLGLSGLLALVLGAVLTVASRQRAKQARE